MRRYGKCTRTYTVHLAKQLQDGVHPNNDVQKLLQCPIEYLVEEAQRLSQPAQRLLDRMRYVPASSVTAGSEGRLVRQREAEHLPRQDKTR